MIKGIGIDIVETMRFETVKDKDHFLKQIFTKQEIRDARHVTRSSQYFSVLFAIKEALFKACRIGLHNGSYWHNVHIKNVNKITISGVFKKIFNKPMHTYESHGCSKRYTCSVVLIE